MLHRPRKGRHFSRYLMGAVFLVCALLLATQNLLAGGVFLAMALVMLYYAPRWNLRIEVTPDSLRFSENVLEIHALELALSDISEIRRVEEKAERKGFLITYPEYRAFVEFQTKAGRIYRMHDIFDDDFDEDILMIGTRAGIAMEGFSRPDTDDGPGED
ncbi:MAG: hypothetical protein ABI036_04595 [Fibrobacteria bacterium]